MKLLREDFLGNIIICIVIKNLTSYVLCMGIFFGDQSKGIISKSFFVIWSEEVGCVVIEAEIQQKNM